jgi:hypothetical protein
MWFITALFITIIAYIDTTTAISVLWISYLLSFIL